MPKEITVDLPAKIGELFEVPDRRYRVAYGGRGSGKSIGFARMLLLRSMEEPMVILCARELQKSMKDSVHSLLVSQVSAMGLDDAFECGREYLRGKNGSNFLFYGLRSNSAEIKSTFGVKIAWVEEAQAVSQLSLDYLFPTVREDNSEIWITFNPDDELDPVYDMFVNSQRGKAAVQLVNYSDNPFFPQVLEDERLEDKRTRPHKYAWIWEGALNINTEAAVYGKWIETAKLDGRIKADLYDPSLPVYTVWDLGYSDDTAIWFFQVAGDEIRLIDYYENRREDMVHYASQLYGRQIKDIVYGPNGKVLTFSLDEPLPNCGHRADFQYGDHYVPHDAANKLLQAGGRSIVNQLFELGIKAKVVNATSQQNQIEGTRATMPHCWFDSERCKEGIRCLKKYSFKLNDQTGSYSKEPVHDIYSHGADAFEIIAQVWKSVRLPENKPKPRFLHETTINELWESGSDGGRSKI